jgi:hypothetical protein
MSGLQGRGVGFGFHKYLFEPFYINSILAKHRPTLLRKYYAGVFALEKLIGPIIPFRYTMEKVVMKATKEPA